MKEITPTVDRTSLILEQLPKGNQGVIAAVPLVKLKEALQTGRERVAGLKSPSGEEASRLRESLRQLGRIIAEIETPQTSGKKAAAKTRESFREGPRSKD